MSQANYASGAYRRGGKASGGPRDQGRRSNGRSGDQSSRTGAANSAGNASGSGRQFRTDTDISATGNGSKGRELQQWQDDEGTDGASIPAGVDLSSLGESSHREGSWDQFKTNREKFGVQTTYDETYYTTAIDRQHPEYQQRAARAAKLAAEIEKQAHGGNVHLAEERGAALDDSGVDEEDKYSGVVRGVALMSANTTPAPAPAPAPTPARGPGSTFEQFLEREAAPKAPVKKFDRMDDLRQFSADYKIASPIPADLKPLLSRSQAAPAASAASAVPATPPAVPAAPAAPAVAPAAAPAAAASKKKFNFAASLQKKVYFKPEAPAAAHVLPPRQFVPQMVPSKPEPRPIGQRFDYFAHLEATGAQIPQPYTVPPTWNPDGTVDFHDQFLPPRPVVMPVMPPFGMMYMRP